MSPWALPNEQTSFRVPPECEFSPEWKTRQLYTRFVASAYKKIRGVPQAAEDGAKKVRIEPVGPLMTRVQESHGGARTRGSAARTCAEPQARVSSGPGRPRPALPCPTEPTGAGSDPLLYSPCAHRAPGHQLEMRRIAPEIRPDQIRQPRQIVRMTSLVMPAPARFPDTTRSFRKRARSVRLNCGVTAQRVPSRSVIRSIGTKGRES